MRQGKPCSDRRKAPVQRRRSCFGASREHSAKPKTGQSGQSTALRSNEHFAQDLPIPIVLLNWQLEILFRNREGLRLLFKLAERNASGVNQAWQKLYRVSSFALVSDFEAS